MGTIRHLFFRVRIHYPLPQNYDVNSKKNGEHFKRKGLSSNKIVFQGQAVSFRGSIGFGEGYHLWILVCSLEKSRKLRLFGLSKQIHADTTQLHPIIFEFTINKYTELKQKKTAWLPDALQLQEQTTRRPGVSLSQSLYIYI